MRHENFRGIRNGKKDKIKFINTFEQIFAQFLFLNQLLPLSLLHYTKQSSFPKLKLC